MHSESRLMIDVVSTPKVHGNAPEDGELGESAPDIWHVPEELRAALLAEMAVAEHG